jgi:hypothetical protein
MSKKGQSAYEFWTWERCADKILSLKNRMGYDERLWILGFELLQDGTFMDPFHGLLLDPGNPENSTSIPLRHSAVPEMYSLLFTYASATEIPLSGEMISIAALDILRRPELSAYECMDLLKYTQKDLSAISTHNVPFFGKQLEMGDFSFVVHPLPCVPMTFVLWYGDDEVPNGGTLLFDRSARHYLRYLLRELSWLTVWRLRNILDPKVRWGEPNE